ncbi:hypothetical protein JMJ35_008240 [Cladonia borealis]|uniref:Uncharacterized protein n=1 Tax=Cladonia borealis TaxID=184061 RepID=A0AA39QV20_9LECA|nr:hypothetical protein JMJ35_008240 [Cladonia borealis]
MRDHITPVMHRQFMSMAERNIASAEIRNMTPEHSNPESLIPSNIPDSLSELPQTLPSLANGLSPSDLNDYHHQHYHAFRPRYGTSNGSAAPPSKPIPGVLANPRLEKNLKITKHVRLASTNDADANGREGLDSEQKKCQQNKQQPPQTPSPHPPNGSLPPQPIPHNNNSNNPTTPFPQNLNHKLLTIHTQRRAEKETPRAGPQSNTRHASENVMLEKRKDDDDDNDDVETILGDGEEEDMGGVLYRCGERTREEYEGLKLEIVMDWRWSWKRLHIMEPILCL